MPRVKFCLCGHFKFNRLFDTADGDWGEQLQAREGEGGLEKGEQRSGTEAEAGKSVAGMLFECGLLPLTWAETRFYRYDMWRKVASLNHT